MRVTAAVRNKVINVLGEDDIGRVYLQIIMLGEGFFKHGQ